MSRADSSPPVHDSAADGDDSEDVDEELRELVDLRCHLGDAVREDAVAGVFRDTGMLLSHGADARP